ncbi:MAG TPA: hypothetical protein DEQ47_16265 [Solibacterales bacterium]|nr:hypothetical protein [Bryobacterales bacterium]
MRDTEIAVPVGILSEDFAQAAAAAGLRARQESLAAGHPVVYADNLDRYVKEMPDGKRFEVRFEPGKPRESHLHIVRELPA